MRRFSEPPTVPGDGAHSLAVSDPLAERRVRGSHLATAENLHEGDPPIRGYVDARARRSCGTQSAPVA